MKCRLWEYIEKVIFCHTLEQIKTVAAGEGPSRESFYKVTIIGKICQKWIFFDPMKYN